MILFREVVLNCYVTGMEFVEKVKKSVVEHQMLKSGDAVLVGLSGGPDSVALLYILSKLRNEMNLRLGAVYINHNLRPKAVRKEESFCASLCKKLKVEFVVVEGDIKTLSKVQKKGIEETARDFRYSTYYEIAMKEGYNKIALGHHADDQVETILFRIIRGTGRKGLLGIPRKRGMIIRPLLDVSKEEIVAYLKKHKIGFCTDTSNTSLKYSRNYIRHRLLKDIRVRFNPQINATLLGLADILEQEEEFLDNLTLRAHKACIRKTISGKFELDLPRLQGYDKWLRRRLLRLCLQELAGVESGDRQTVQRLDGLVLAGDGSISVPGGIQASIIQKKLFIYKRKAVVFTCDLTLNNYCNIPNLRIRIGCRISKAKRIDIKEKRRQNKVSLDYDTIELPLVVRNIVPGDRFQPLGMKGTKKVGDYLTDRKIPAVYRDEIPVVCDKQGIVWLVGFEISERVKVENSTRKVLNIEVINKSNSAETV